MRLDKFRKAFEKQLVVYCNGRAYGISTLDKSQVLNYSLAITSDFYNRYQSAGLTKNDIERVKGILLNEVDTFKFADENIDFRLQIVDMKSNVLVGGITFYEDNGDTYLGIWILPKFQKLGLAQRSISQVEMLLRDKIKELHCEVATKNIPSLRMLTKLGFKVYDTSEKGNYLLMKKIA